MIMDHSLGGYLDLTMDSNSHLKLSVPDGAAIHLDPAHDPKIAISGDQAALGLFTRVNESDNDTASSLTELTDDESDADDAWAAHALCGNKRGADISLRKDFIEDQILLHHKRNRLATPVKQETTDAVNETLASDLDAAVDIAVHQAKVSANTPPAGDPNDKNVEGTKNSSFNIFEAIVANQDLACTLIAQMDVTDVLSLYAISRSFHLAFNTNYMNNLLESARKWAPHAMKVFHFKSYGDLCIVDPRNKNSSERSETHRNIPSLRWLRMVTFRERVAREILDLLAAEGHRMPDIAVRTVLKLWLLMTIPNNATRIALIHNEQFWLKSDLVVASMFTVKLDMRFSDPINGLGDAALRNLLLGQRSFVLMWKALRGEALRDEVDFMREFARYTYEPPRNQPDLAGLPIMGIPAHQIGALKWENWSQRGRVTKLMRPDQLVVRECVKRGLPLDKMFVEFMLYGYVDPETGENIPLPKKSEADRVVDDMIKEDEVDHEKDYEEDFDKDHEEADVKEEGIADVEMEDADLGDGPGEVAVHVGEEEGFVEEKVFLQQGGFAAEEEVSEALQAWYLEAADYDEGEYDEEQYGLREDDEVEDDEEEDEGEDDEGEDEEVYDSVFADFSDNEDN